METSFSNISRIVEFGKTEISNYHPTKWGDNWIYHPALAAGLSQRERKRD